MKLSKIRDNNNKKLDTKSLKYLANKLPALLKEIGFEVKGEILNSTSIKLGLHGCSFRIIPEKLGYNYRIGSYVNTKSGKKRTRTPTWQQRVEFNNFINNFLDCRLLKCNIKSGIFTIRDHKHGAYNEQDWLSQDTYNSANGLYNGLGQLVQQIVSEKDVA